MSFTPEQLEQIKKAAAQLEEQKKVWNQDKLEVFEQLIKLKPFAEWAADNIIVNKEVSHVNREILITVIYKGEYGGNRTSLERLTEIRELIVSGETDLLDLPHKILEIIDFDVTKEEPEEERDKDENKSN